MAYKPQILLGTITKAHGFEGAVTVRLEKGFIENVPEMESVFIEFEGKPVPFFITYAEYPGGDVITLKFDGIDSVQKAKEFSRCRVFLTSGEPEYNAGEDIKDLIGFKIFSSENKKIGIIKDLTENPGQILLNVDTGDDREILIPFHENLIVKVDKRKKIIRMDLPEGLTELNS